MAGGFIGAFTGSSNKKEADAATRRADAEIRQGRSDAYGYQDQGIEQYRPWAEGGRLGGKLYEDLHGLRGAGARTAGQQLYLDDDILSQMRERDRIRTHRGVNARGYSDSGVGALADSRVMLEGYGGYLNRLAGLGDRGFAASQGMAGLYGAKAGTAMSAAGALSDNYWKNAQSRAQANTGFAQNMVGLGQLGVSAFTGMPVGSMNKLASATGMNNLGKSFIPPLT